ncbi:cytochrome c family protein [Novosphingobium sp. BW1]|uniref:c-type cytochrome n=1 Tax=Novosphingobium sp. BW1 TaxID=2592621 RepID=UPI0011DEB842|nr:c-type cytochrome [Novosphingobium sp. BW1]TYC89350.1 c-type cytochrome [Novosphingobium sp. BW1]
MKLTSLICASPLVLLAACGGSGSQEDSAAPAADTAGESPAAAEAAPAAPAAASAAPAAFQICKTCHAVEPGQNRVGPTLHGIVGSTAGEVEGYNFSPALKDSGIVWTPEALDKWLQGPMKMVPGTKMVQMVPDAGKRQEIIEYLETLK